jgi:hypothetical protein
MTVYFCDYFIGKLLKSGGLRQIQPDVLVRASRTVGVAWRCKRCGTSGAVVSTSGKLDDGGSARQITARHGENGRPCETTRR